MRAIARGNDLATIDKGYGVADLFDILCIVRRVEDRSVIVFNDTHDFRMHFVLSDGI